MSIINKYYWYTLYDHSCCLFLSQKKNQTFSDFSGKYIMQKFWSNTILLWVSCLKRQIRWDTQKTLRISKHFSFQKFFYACEK